MIRCLLNLCLHQCVMSQITLVLKIPVWTTICYKHIKHMRCSVSLFGTMRYMRSSSALLFNLHSIIQINKLTSKGFPNAQHLSFSRKYRNTFCLLWRCCICYCGAIEIYWSNSNLSNWLFKVINIKIWNQGWSDVKVSSGTNVLIVIK